MKKAKIFLLIIGITLFGSDSLFKKVAADENSDIVDSYFEEVDYFSILVELPKINVKTVVYYGTKSMVEIHKGVALYYQSILPGEDGNIILVGHSGNSKVSHFRDLKKMNEGDSIYIYYQGIKYEYVVFDKKLVESDETSVLQKTKENTLTLITCNGLFTDKRLVVLAELLFFGPIEE